MPRAGAQRLEPEAVEEVVSGGQGPDDRELVDQDPPHVLTPQGTHPVGRGRAGPKAGLEFLDTVAQVLLGSALFLGTRRTRDHAST